MPSIGAWATGTDRPPGGEAIGLLPLASACETWSSASVPCPPTNDALLWLQTTRNGSGLPGVTVAIAGATDVFYAKPDLDIDLSLVETTTSGNALAYGLGNTEVIVTLSHATLSTCHAASSRAWPGPSTNTIRVPVRPGFRSYAQVTCE
jgi:hypothetical protein